MLGSILQKKFTLTYLGLSNFLKWKKAEIQKSYYSTKLSTRLQKERMRAINTFGVGRVGFAKEPKKSYYQGRKNSGSPTVRKVGEWVMGLETRNSG